MFRGLTIYQLTQGTAAVEERLRDALKLKKHHFRPCKDYDPHSQGFAHPLGPGSKEMSFETDNALLFCVRRDEKAVPPAAVKEAVNAMEREKLAKKEEVSKTDLRLFREQVIEKMLPGAVPAPSWTYAYLDKSLAMLFVAASEKDADEFVEWIKTPLGGVPFKLLGLNDVDPSDKFTEWLRDPESNLGERFRLGSACSLKHAKEGGTAVFNINHEDLESEDLHALIEAGKKCCRIALEDDDLHFAVTAKLGLRSMSLSEDRKADLADDDDGIPTTQTANEFATTLRCVRAVMGELESLLGGWPKQEMLDLQGEAA